MVGVGVAGVTSGVVAFANCVFLEVGVVEGTDMLATGEAIVVGVFVGRFDAEQPVTIHRIQKPIAWMGKAAFL
jgi:hypothetical protein